MTEASLESPTPPSTGEQQVELAQSRTLLALDRTLLAFVRTSLSLITFGFALAKFVRYMAMNGQFHGITAEYSRVLGVIMIVLGIIGLVGGAQEYMLAIKRIRPAVDKSPWSASLIITLVLAVMGVVILVDLFHNLELW